MQTLISAIIIATSTSYILFLDYIAASPRSLLKALVIPVAALIALFYIFSKTSKQSQVDSFQKFTFLLWATISVQMIVIATGGIQSPFLILIHLCMVGMSFTYNFSIATIFLLCSFLILIIDKSFHQNLFLFILEDPSTFTLHITSIISILPIAYVFSRQYHLKEMLLNMLKSQIKTNEKILMGLEEMVIITDSQLRILSVNKAFEREICRSRLDLISVPIFDILFLQDTSGLRVTKESFLAKDGKPPPIFKGDYTLILPESSPKKIAMQVQAVEDTGLSIDQIVFIINPQQTPSKNIALLGTMDKTRAKYDAMSESIKTKLLALHLPVLKMHLLLLEKLEYDLYSIQFTAERLMSYGAIHADIAKLCQQVVRGEDEFSKILGVPLSMTPVSEQVAEIEYYATSNVEGLELIIKKLVEIALLVASSERGRKVNMAITQDKKMITITIIGSCPKVSDHEVYEMFLPSYGRLLMKTNMVMGSGLEGYLAKFVADTLSLPLEVHVRDSQDSSQLVISLQVKK